MSGSLASSSPLEAVGAGPARPGPDPSTSARRRPGGLNEPESFDPAYVAAAWARPFPALVPYAGWKNACHQVAGAVLAGQRRVLVTGPSGTGKSLLMAEVTRILCAAGWGFSLGAGAPPRSSETHAWLIDDAQSLSPSALADILASRTDAVILAASGPLPARIRRAATFPLPALSREEARDFIAEWLTLSGRTPDHLESAAARRVVELAGGIARDLSALLAAAAGLAGGDPASVIRLRDVQAAADLRRCFTPRTEAGARRGSGAGLAAAMIALAAAGFALARLCPVTTTQALVETEHGVAAAGSAARDLLGLAGGTRLSRGEP